MANQRISGFGADVTTHFPCPFCAAPEWLAHRVDDFDYKAMQAGATCAECGRSAKFVVTRADGSVSSELVQTGGDDPPKWLDPAPRRA